MNSPISSSRVLSRSKFRTCLSTSGRSTLYVERMLRAPLCFQPTISPSADRGR
jgi:hypothetical protein